MLWQKSWCDTRWRFLIGLGLLMMFAMGTVFDYPAVAKLRPLVHESDAGTAVGRAINEALALESSYRGFIWLQWFRQNLTQTLTLLAVILGSGGLLGSALFTLSLPVSRRRLVFDRAAVVLGELFVLAMVPSLAIPALSALVGQRYSVADAAVHGACAFVGAAVFLALACVLSTRFADVWRPLLISCGVAATLGLCGAFVPALWTYGVFGAMGGGSYFRTGALPWGALAFSAALAIALFWTASLSLERRDF